MAVNSGGGLNSVQDIGALKYSRTGLANKVSQYEPQPEIMKTYEFPN